MPRAPLDDSAPAEAVPVDGDPEDDNHVDGDPVDADPVDGDPEDGDPEDGDRHASTLGIASRAAGLWAAEAAAAVGAAALLTSWARRIALDPFPRQAQVSALAHLQLQFWGLGAVAIAVALVSLRWRKRTVGAVAERLACAITAGLATSTVAGAVVVGLNGSPWGLGSDNYDARNLASWAAGVSAGHPIPSGVYPPGFVYLLSWLSELTGQNTFYALKDLQIAGAALLGPLVYLAWRLVMRPTWALCVGTIAALPLVDAYKPSSSLVLALAIPVFVALVQVVRRSGSYRLPVLVGFGAGFGVVLGLLVLLHPMYLVWSAPGVVVAIGLTTPWREAWRRTLLLLATSLLAFGAVCGHYLFRFLTEAGDTKENFVYFDALQDPAYFLMWRGGTPGNVGEWPPRGELGGVGLFAIVLVIGVGIALALGHRRSLVVTVACCFGSVWVWRLYDASQMYDMHEVRLWPRTSLALVYCAFLLTGAAALAVSRTLKLRTEGAAVLGCVVAALLVFGMAGSATADRYLPRGGGQAGYLTYLGQNTPTLNGHCSRWTRPQTTATGRASCKPRSTK